MGKKNVFKDFIWDKDGNGNYVVTCLLNGFSILVIPRLGNRNYCISKSKDMVKNFYGQDVPKQYNKFEIMNILMNMNGTEEICLKW